MAYILVNNEIRNLDKELIEFGFVPSYRLKYKIMHEGGCGGIAFYSFVDHSDGGRILKSSDVLLVNGDHPTYGSKIVCSSCGGAMKSWWKYDPI